MSRNQQRARGVRFDPVRLNQLLLRLELGKSRFADRKSELSRNTVIKAFNGDRILMRTAKILARELQAESVESLVLPDEQNGTSSHDDQKLEVSRWDLEERVGGWVSASNGLQYCVCRMRHRFIDGRIGRGKQYDLGNPEIRGRDHLENYLQRHSLVGERLKDDPHIADVLDVFQADEGDTWWSIDRWIEGPSLDSMLADGPLDRSLLATVMQGVLAGLVALHEAGIVFRELAPQRIIVEHNSHRAVLTDFELAKLMDGQHSVSTDWPEDACRAPEVTGGTIDVRADLYSWARVLLRAATGSLPPAGGDQEALLMAGLPKSVWKTAARCLSPFPDDRPDSARAVQRAISRWK